MCMKSNGPGEVANTNSFRSSSLREGLAGWDLELMEYADQALEV